MDKRKINWKMLILKLTIIGAVIALDMATKVYFAKHPEPREFWPKVISIIYTENTGAAFGAFANQQIVLIIISICLIAVFTAWDILNKDKNIWANLGYAFVIGGAVGNLIDRLFLGYVRDFINFDFVTWGIFNIADTFITIGCILYIVYFLTQVFKQKKGENKNETKRD